MPTRAAHRAQKARRLIRAAYRDDPTFSAERALRYELLGEQTALVRLKHPEAGHLVDVRLAQEQSTGRVIRLLRDNRSEFRSMHEMLEYFERLYGAYGGPNGEPATTISKNEPRTGPLPQRGGLKLLK
ncbi:MAG TPA: hypothetical protein VN706_18740 [Gemmatimonadaceae bacterium]|nr:hypothetical protein [Gemmatimonadaceae bacterium]